MPKQDIIPADRESAVVDAALDWIQSTFARTVALKLTPILLPVLGGVSFWLQDVLGIDMNPAVAAAFVVAVVVGAGGAIVTYVRNHGQGASEVLQKALDELVALRKAGEAELEHIAGADRSHRRG